MKTLITPISSGFRGRFAVESGHNKTAPGGALTPESRGLADDWSID